MAAEPGGELELVVELEEEIVDSCDEVSVLYIVEMSLLMVYDSCVCERERES